MNRIKMNEIIKTFGVFLAVVILAIGLVLPQPASAALPAPTFMPGFPMLAGPQIIIMWGPVPGAVKYNVYLDGAKIGESPAMQYMGLAPATGGVFKYQVTAVDAAGAESEKSSEKSITIVIVEPPKDLISLPQNDRVMIRWTAAPGAVIYDVFRRKKGEQDYVMITSVTSIRFDDTDVEPGVIYQYAVKSKDSAGKVSGFSEPLDATLLVVEKKEMDSKKIPLRLLPTTPIVRLELNSSPFDVVAMDTWAVISGGELLLLPDIKNLDETTLVPLLPEAQRNRNGYRGLELSRDGSKLYVVQTSPPALLVIDMAQRVIEDRIDLKEYAPEEGELVYMTASGKQTLKSIPNPYDVALDDEEKIYISDVANSRVMVFSPEYTFEGTVGFVAGEELVEGKDPDWYMPALSFLNVTGDGNLNVSGLYYVNIFDIAGDGTLTGQFGGPGNTVGKFGKPGSLLEISESRLLVTDTRNRNIQMFYVNDEGEWEYKYLLADDKKKGNALLAMTLGIALTPDESRIFASEPFNKTVSILDIHWDKKDAFVKPE